MPLFVMYGLDGPEGPEIRRTTRPAHLDWIGLNATMVRAAGPMMSADGSQPVGSLLIIEADDLPSAQAFLSEDPYTLAGLWARTDIRPFNWIAGTR
jgi:uncharacterized protein YciI